MYFVEDEKIAENLQRRLNAERRDFGASEEENLRPTDPRLEYRDPTPNIHELFVLLDKRYFWGELGMVEVKWSRRMTTCAGLCYYQGRNGLCCIKLSAPLLSLRPRKDLVETLLHEMIHAYLFVTEAKADREDHGPKFRKHMHRINREAGTEITIYHTFNDEVAYYQRHIWRCNGICRDRRPFFGFVRRAMNRAPGPNDFWWKEHQMNCGGDFVKVSEPEKHCKKKVKQDKDKTVKNKCETRDIRDYFWPSTSFKEGFPSNTQNIKTVRDLSDINKHSEGRARGGGTLDQTQVVKSETNGGRPGASKTTSRDEDDKNEYLRVRATVRNAWANKYLPSSKVEQKPDGPDSCSPITIKMKRREISCPVCGSPFSETLINEHVEECLSKVECVQIVNETVREKEEKTGESQGLREGSPNGELVPCPVCGKALHRKDLNDHFETCLDLDFEGADASEGDGTECERVPCPCCLEWVLEKSINDHVDECLAHGPGESPKWD